MPILTTRSPVPRSALSASMAARIRKPAIIACSGLMKVAITASPIVFTTAPFLRGDDFQQGVEMRTHQIECGEISDPLVQRGGALEVGEKERQRRDLQALIDIEIVGLEDVAEGLVGQHPLGGEERLALA